MALGAVTEVRRVLEELSQDHGMTMAAVISRAGIPIAWNLPKDVHLENFATLSATLVGAAEVIYTGLGRPSPNRITVDSPDGTLVAIGIGPKAFLVLLAEDTGPELLDAAQNAVSSLREALQAQA